MNIRNFCFTLLLAASLPAHAAPDARTAVIAQARSLIGVREATGHNDGPAVESMLALVGASKGDPWCAAFNYACFQRAGLGARVPRSAWSPDWLHNPDWKSGRPQRPDASIQSAVVFGIYFPSKGRIAHTGLVEKRAGAESVITIEGNTNGGGSRDGDGVYRRRRLLSQVWLKDWLR